MHLLFKINKYYLVGYTLSSKNKPFPGWEKLEEKIWQKYKEEPAYYFLNPKYVNWALEKIQTDLTDNDFQSIFLKNISILGKIYQEIFETKEFKKLYEETEKHLVSARKQWTENEKEALKILRDISGLEIPKDEIAVYITHPKSHNGKVINQKTIACGHEEKWKNHLTICLCHELLHIMTWPGHFQPNFEILHAIIMLADNELKIRLNKKGIYFKENGKCVESSNFLNIEKKILPYWEKYLDNKLNGIKDIKQFKKYIANLLKKKGVINAPFK